MKYKCYKKRGCELLFGKTQSKKFNKGDILEGEPIKIDGMTYIKIDCNGYRSVYSWKELAKYFRIFKGDGK